MKFQTIFLFALTAVSSVLAAPADAPSAAVAATEDVAAKLEAFNALAAATNRTLPDVSALDIKRVCETSGGSPLSSDVIDMLLELEAHGSGNACQDRASNGGCTKIWQAGTAALNLCGNKNHCTSWEVILEATFQLYWNCGSGNPRRVGGKYHVANYLRMDLFHN